MFTIDRRNRGCYAIFSVVLTLVAAGCGSAGTEQVDSRTTAGNAASTTTTAKAAETLPTEPSTATTAAPPTSSTTTAGTAMPPSTEADEPTISVMLMCVNGNTVTVEVQGTDEGQIDDQLNSIESCENDDGSTSATFNGCQNTRTVTIDANDGEFPDFDTIDYCENDGEG